MTGSPLTRSVIPGEGSRFKVYVHRILDQAGIPSDPTPERTQITGCRIEGRLHYMLLRMNQNLKPPSPCRYCGVLIAWDASGPRSIGCIEVDDGKLSQHICKISNVAKYRSYTKQKEKSNS